MRRVVPTMRAVYRSSTSTYHANAKVNLCLRIVGRRPDGYHLLDSVFAAVDLTDRIRISIRDVQPQGDTHIEVQCPYPGIPNDESNLAARAAATLLENCGLGAKVTIEIDKQIPPGAGLGGGSSNAAAVLRCLMASLPLEVSDTRLRELALQLGADVPFFLIGGCARVRGIGERVEPIRGWPGLPLLIALPPIAVSTAWAFRAYSGRFSHEPEEPSRMASGMEPGAGCLVNDLEDVVLAAHPRIAEVKRALLDAGAGGAVMSGSGAAVVGLVPSSANPQDIADRFRARHPDVRIHQARILPALPRPSVDRTASYA